MNSCGFNGRASVVRIGQGVAWVEADDRIHVTAELLDSKSASEQVEKKYLIGEWCAEVRAYHATRKDDE